ncbi:hypothetical protein [Cognatazoarcus halotolerans]|uniref:hypothetical protein n=1 Tax=Cognatazoarcus halotolerans TaxID=2686016 RepID=UPI0013581AB3|nr:hypothetical protein [Cognatazoarcus halotolerans]MCA8917298.1 hypothetical protein [Planctomycetota bacterium]
MDFFVALDILLGLSLVYLVFALVVSSINEFIAAFASSRARWLRRGVASLLSADPKALNMPEAKSVLDSPYVSYLGTAGIGNTFKASYVSAWTLMQGVLSRVEGFKEDAFARVGEIRALAEKLPAQSPIRSVLIDLCARANGDLASFQKLLDGWFATFETQLTAWYRQKTHYVLVGLSFLVAVAMNVDTVGIVRQLSADPKVRNAVVEEAMKAADKKTIEGYIDFTPRDKARDAFETASSVFKTAEAALANCPKPGDKTTSGTAAQEHGAPVCDHVELEKQLKKAQSDRSLRRDELQTQQDALDQRIKGRADALSNTGLHIGWDKNEFTEWHESFWTWPSFTKLVGLLVSAFAIALGAPFWFNMLKSVASMRSVGVNAGEKKDEGKAK